jgi:hypothetical protein
MSRTVGKRALTVLMGVLLAVGVAVVTPTVAQAAKSDCASGRMCFWYNQNYSGTDFYVVDSDTHLGVYSDKAHSVYNHTSVAWVLYDDLNFDPSDRHFCIRAGVSHPDIGAGPYRFGDKITSVRKLTSNSCGTIPQISQG